MLQQHVAVVDLNSLLQFVVLALAAAFGFLYLVRNTASRFFVVDSSFSSSDYSSSSDHRRPDMAAEVAGSCAICGQATTKQCARCKMVKYCSAACQTSHWSSEHKAKCKDLQSLYNANHAKSTSMLRERKASAVSSSRRSKIIKPSNRILFPYEEFIDLFSGDKPNYPPCGLLNCGNSCFANVVLQCLTFTRPLAVYLLEKGHRAECERNDWCFLCEFQTHVERASKTRNPFSPINILSRLANIGGNLGYGKQEDAHEFMRFAIDTMQSVCLDEFGGEKAVHPKYQETTLIQHIFGGRLQSQVICTECNNVSNQFENMMDLSVEIHGDAGSLEECLDQFTAKEWLHGDNMYRCDGCNAYVMAWKRLTIQRAPNILTIALKRFQSGRFGKLNKRVTFPETLDLSPYMSEIGDGNDIYKLYAVIVHVDMLNASFFGHYICYVKDFCGNWYRVDDCKVAPADLDEVLSQGAYMLLYKRISPRPSCLLPAEPMMKQENKTIKLDDIDPTPEQPAECLSAARCHDSLVNSEHLPSASSSTLEIESEEELSPVTGAEDAREDIKAASSGANLPIVEDFELHDSKKLSTTPKLDAKSLKDTNQSDVRNIESSSPVSNVENGSGASTTDSNGSLLRMPAEESSATEDCLLEKGNNTFDVSVSPLATSRGEVLDEMRPANSTSMLENGFGNGAANKSNGKNSRPKPKPVFARGFLVKHPRKEFIKQDNKVMVDQNNQVNEVARQYSHSENGGIWNEGKEPCSVFENRTVPNGI